MRKLLAILLTVLSLSCALNTEAGTIDRGQRVLRLMMAADTDSLYAEMTTEMQSAIGKMQLKVMWHTLQLTFGKLQSMGEWTEQTTMGYDIAACPLQMEHGRLLFSVTFAGDRIAGMFFTRHDAQAQTTTTEADTTGTDIHEEHEWLECDGYRMPAILTRPASCTDAPCIVIVHGSGPNDMDGTVGSNKPYRELALRLAKAGVATFRYDKRTYTYRQMTDSVRDNITIDYETTDDAIAAVEMLHSSDFGIDTSRIFILGHSQGGMMIPRIAQRTGLPRGYIMMSAPARPLMELLMMQLAYLYEHGLNPEWPTMKEDMERQIANIGKLGTPDFDEKMPRPMGLPLSYVEDLAGYDQTSEAAHIDKPLLVMNGENDYQVTMDDFAIWQKALAGKSNVVFKSYKGLNHIYHKSGTPSLPSDYTVAGNMPQAVINDISGFVKGE